MEPRSLAEIKEAVADGEIRKEDLAEYHASFEKHFGRKTTLTEDQFLMCVGNFDDDYRDEDAAKMIEAAEKQYA